MHETQLAASNIIQNLTVSQKYDNDNDDEGGLIITDTAVQWLSSKLSWAKSAVT